MAKLDLLTEADLPRGFSYPPAFHRVVTFGLTELDPWYFVDGNALIDLYYGLATRFPERRLVPFARRKDNDDVACWQGASNTEVVIIHDYASPGWELRAAYPDFFAWFRQAIEDFIAWE